MINNIVHTHWKIDFKSVFIWLSNIRRSFREGWISRSGDSTDYSSALTTWVSIKHWIMHFAFVMSFLISIWKYRLFRLFSWLSTLFSILYFRVLYHSCLFWIVESYKVRFLSSISRTNDVIFIHCCR